MPQQEKVTQGNPATLCAICGYQKLAETCHVCGGEGHTLGKRAPLQVGRGNAVVDVWRGIMDVRRAVFVMLFEREFIGQLRLPVAANVVGFGAIIAIGWVWLLPAFQKSFASHPGQTAHDGPHLWLLAVWLTAGPVLLDFLGGWAQEPIRRATEQHMLGATLTTPPNSGARWLDRLQLLLLVGITTLMAMAIVLIPWVGLPVTVLLGGAMAAIVWLQPPQAVRGMHLRERLMQLRRNPWRALGTGLGIQTATLIPFVNVLALLPVATIAATSAFLHFDKAKPTGKADVDPVEPEQSSPSKSAR